MAEGTLARVVITVAAISGLGAVALVVTFLFSLYGSYQRREMRVVMLQASAGAPPSAVALLETYAQLDLVERLPDLFRDWQAWAAEVLDSHVAYPLLGYFRSSHDNLSWISALGTVLDASSLVLTTVEGLPRGDAKLFKRMGTHLVEDISNLGFQSGRPEPASTGRPSRRPATGWRSPAMPSRRATSRGRRSRPLVRRTPARLEAMASYWATPAAQWLGDPVALHQPLHEPDDPVRCRRSRRALVRRPAGRWLARRGWREVGMSLFGAVRLGITAWEPRRQTAAREPVLADMRAEAWVAFAAAGRAERRESVGVGAICRTEAGRAGRLVEICEGDRVTRICLEMT